MKRMLLTVLGVVSFFAFYFAASPVEACDPGQGCGRCGYQCNSNADCCTGSGGMKDRCNGDFGYNCTPSGDGRSYCWSQACSPSGPTATPTSVPVTQGPQVGNVLGRVWVNGAVTRSPGSQVGQPAVCANAPQYDSAVRVEGIGDYRQVLCNTGGPYYTSGLVVPVGTRYVSLLSGAIGRETKVTWTCSTDSTADTATICNTGTSGTGTRVQVNVASGKNAHVHFRVDAGVPSCRQIILERNGQVIDPSQVNPGDVVNIFAQVYIPSGVVVTPTSHQVAFNIEANGVRSVISKFVDNKSAQTGGLYRTVAITQTVNRGRFAVFVQSVLGI